MDSPKVVATYTISVIELRGGYEAAMFTSNNHTVGIPQWGTTQDDAVRRLFENVIVHIEERANCDDLDHDQEDLESIPEWSGLPWEIPGE